MKKKIAILGNGVAGASLALKLRELGFSGKILIISEESPFFFSRPSLMYIYMGHMQEKHTQPIEPQKWDEFHISRIQTRILEVNTHKNQLITQDQNSIDYDQLILATGSIPNKFGWPGQNLNAVQGLYHLQDLYTMEKWTPSTKRAVIVGGGLIGIEMAEMFLSRGIRVSMLVRESTFWGNVLPREESQIINQHIADHHIELLLENELHEILPDANGRVCAILTKTGLKIECEFVGLTVGVKPNIDFLKNTSIKLNRGILVNSTNQTNITNVYAIGDCAEFISPSMDRRPLEQVWYTAKMQAHTLAQTLTGNATHYNPGIWYNSAKFLDIEYQTYGYVLPNDPAGFASFVWSQNEKLIRIVFNNSTKSVRGFNFFAIRARHNICEKWISEKRPITYCLSHLGALNFDPEFFKSFEKDCLHKWNQENPNDKLQLKTSKGLFSKIHKKLLGVK
jgi:NAD(P)H-nitrite reductase large subunit